MVFMTENKLAVMLNLYGFRLLVMEKKSNGAVMLRLEGQDSHQNNLGWSHVYVESNLRVMLIGFMLHNLDELSIGNDHVKKGLSSNFLRMYIRENSKFWLMMPRLEFLTSTS